MNQQSLKRVRHFLSEVWGLFLLIFLVACEEGTGPVTSSPTAAPPRATPPATTIPSPTPSPSPVPLKTYQGSGYVIDYPRGWDVSVGTDGPVSFSDPQGSAYLTITMQANPQGSMNPSTLADAGLQIFKTQVQNYQAITVAPTTRVANETWTQEAATGDMQSTDQTSTVTFHTVVIATNYPSQTSTTKGFTITYGVDIQFFDQTMKNAFQPMLSSFQFIKETGTNS